MYKRGNFKICNCCLYIGPLLLINMYCTNYVIKLKPGGGISLNSKHMALTPVPNTEAPSLASAKRQPGHAAGGWSNRTCKPPGAVHAVGLFSISCDIFAPGGRTVSPGQGKVS